MTSEYAVIQEESMSALAACTPGMAPLVLIEDQTVISARS